LLVDGREEMIGALDEATDEENDAEMAEDECCGKTVKVRTFVPVTSLVWTESGSDGSALEEVALALALTFAEDETGMPVLVEQSEIVL